jgi:3-hydroxyacyl-[acyl-carrier-protein] dehydratase
MQSLQQELPVYCQEFQVGRQGRCLSISSLFCFPPSFLGFAGHFPDMPVLPAIIQLATIRHLAEMALEKQLVPIGYGKTRFRGVIAPDESIHCSLLLEEVKDQWTGRFSIRRMDGELVTDGSCTFSAEG